MTQETLTTDHYPLSQLKRKIQTRKKRRQPIDRLQAQYDALYADSHAQYLARKAALPRPKLNADLPVLAEKEKIKQLIEKNQVVIISGETGSGKTTQLPQLCLDLGLGARGMIAHTQPRRIAARSVAERIAEELDVPLGQQVGYQVRFDEKIADNTIIKLMTDGMLLAETLSDKFLNRYEVIIVDEAHERSLNIDFLLGYLHRLLEKRKDLKLIITSATIDADKFAAHFNHAPQINVSGRSYPVEIRYRPPQEDEELSDAIVQAIEELDSDSPHQRGDTLIFLPTERDIREIADHLRKAEIKETDILPLFGRLSLADQNAVFHPQARRRIVLATNVAETSLTVPRIRNVIDTGTARISRYSLRTKTQRLPIEAVSQASANQRAGRCGRISAGTCIRLYSEEDYQNRPEYTEPEILRTNLAAVILQMLALKLGDIENFPFVDSPDQRQINDGYRLLYELQAVDQNNHLTPLGRKMAQLPIDPRYARIVFEAEKNHCLHEALIILAALSIQDPRERPFSFETQADQKQGEFADPQSDFQTLLNLFAAYQNQRHAKGSNALRRWCKSYYLNALRMREWRELTNQLIRDSRNQKLKLNDYHPQPDPEAAKKPDGSKGKHITQNPNLAALHRAILAGHLDHVGLWDQQNQDYLGPRNRRFRIFPASVLTKKRPQSLMAASIIEMQQTYARTCAPIDLHELEPLAAHITKSQYQQPHWSKKAGNVMAEETILLYGLPIISGRKKPYAQQDPETAHDIFIQQALVTGEINTRLKVIAENVALRDKLETLEDKTRSRGILIDDQAIANFYHQRLPENVYSTVTLEKWAKQHGEASLKMQKSDLLETAPIISKTDYPDHLNIRGHRIPLSYEFNPGSETDGITATIALAALNALTPKDFERLIPAMLGDKIEALLRRLPKTYRRMLVPIPDIARAITERISDNDASLIPAIIGAIKAIKGNDIPEDAFDPNAIEPHHHMNFRLIDANHRILAQNRDLIALQQQYQDKAAQQFQKRSQSTAGDIISDTPIEKWQWQSLPAQQTLKGGITGYPALTLEEDKLYLRHHDTAERAEYAHRRGVMALLSRELREQHKYLQKNLPGKTEMALHYRKISNDTYLIDDLLTALIEKVCLPTDAPLPRTEVQYQAALEKGKKYLISEANRLGPQLARILKHYSDLNARLRSLKHKSAKTDIERQLKRLIYPNFIRYTPANRLPDLERYLKGIALRLDKLEREPLKDVQRQRQITPWEEYLEKQLQALNLTHPNEIPKNTTQIDKKQALLQTYFYLLEEYRIQVFAQEIGTKGKVSEKLLQEKMEN
ncbi:ATP-dependent RNA helicase HrpA [Suttonella ornithocola]|uniref:ATP-dependent RNA helicase HrpA n=1 Tax=Suttonella ornithocola TaxID=279832 RepID=A0A380MUR0_9GAMM|nr:ATP-dependent RNA helicase HrpA [Suttonella ornithocola]SUO96330.1 ATP-dependent RNA helicase HrpA [Suttonella ornithocola]